MLRKYSRRPVSRILSRTIIPLGVALLRTLIATYPRVWRAGPARALPLAPQRFPPIWSCSVWGLPCLRLYSRSGALLPHLFTLTLLLRAGRYFLCGTCRPEALTLRSRTLSGTLPCGVRTFLSRRDFAVPRQRSPSRLPSLSYPIVRHEVLNLSSFANCFAPPAAQVELSDCGPVCAFNGGEK